MALQLTDRFQPVKQVARYTVYLSVFVAVVGGVVANQISSVQALDDTSFITTWKTDNPGASNSSSITIPTRAGQPAFPSGYYTYEYDIDWDNDGVFDEFGVTGDATHDYGTPGTYTVRIQGTFPAFYAPKLSDNEKLLEVNQWGAVEWRTMAAAFYTAKNLTVPATDTPDLSQVTELSEMFYRADNLTGDFSQWDVSNIVNMSNMFAGAGEFTSDLSNWDTHNVTEAWGMFNSATSFTSDLSNWDVSKVESMALMFNNARLFNSDLSNWNVSNVRSMESMFNWAFAFNGNISSWNVSNVTSMKNMFTNATSFNADISAWGVGNVTDMFEMFKDATLFDADISSWDITKVERLDDMLDATSITTEHYDALLSGWSVQPVKHSMGFSAHPACYTDSASRRVLTEDKGWSIRDTGRCGGGTPEVYSAGFSESGGKKFLTLNGVSFFSEPGWFEGVDIFYVPYVSLNGSALPMCVDTLGVSIEDIEMQLAGVSDMLGVQPRVTLDAPCVQFVEFTDDGQQNSFTSEKVVIWLPDSFDVTKPGSVLLRDVNRTRLLNENVIEMTSGFTYSFNAPQFTVDGDAIEEVPTISKRPTFSGTAKPGATVTVTVHSDPVVCTTTADQDGNWSCTLPADLPPGTHTVYVRVVAVDTSVEEFGPYAVTVEGVSAGVIDNTSTPGAPNTGFVAQGLNQVVEFAAQSQAVAISSFGIAGAFSTLFIGGIAYIGRRALRRRV